MTRPPKKKLETSFSLTSSFSISPKPWENLLPLFLTPFALHPYPPKKQRHWHGSFVGFAGAADFDVKHPRRNGSCSSQGCMSGCYGQRSLRGTWPWDHPPVVGSNDMPIKRFLYQTQPWGNQRSHGETPPGQLVEANVISESVFLMFLVSFGGSKSKIEQNNTQLWIIC